MGKVGKPILAATIVACLSSGELYLLNGILMLTGIGMIGLSHWRGYCFKGNRGKPGYD